MRTITFLFALWALFYGRNTASICTKQRCDFLKALLPFFIILHHHAQRTDWPWPLDGDFCVLGAPVVMMFFFISGYGLEYKRASKGLKLSELPSRLKKLFTPTLLPIVMYVSCLFSFGEIDKLSSTLSDCLYPLPFSWFVVILALLYTGFYLCAYLAKTQKSFIILLFLMSLATILALKFLHAKGWIFGSDMALFVGALYKQYENKLLKVLNWKGMKYLTTAVAVMFVFIYLRYVINIKLLNQSQYCWLALMFMMFAYVNVYKSKVTDFFSKISYDIYLCQGLAFEIIPCKEVNFAVSFIVIVFITIAIATFNHYVNTKIWSK